MEFISLAEVVNAVAREVPIPSGWSDPYECSKEELLRTVFLRQHMKNSFAKKVYRISEAAAVLDQKLHNAMAQERPRWFDSWHTGRPKHFDEAGVYAMKMLEHMANWFARSENAYREGRDPLGLLSGWMQCEGQFKNEQDPNLAGEIGFDRLEIIKFLNACGIPFRFDPVVTEQAMLSEVQPVQDSDRPQEIEFDQGKEIKYLGGSGVPFISIYDKTEVKVQSNGPAPIPTPQMADAFDGCLKSAEQWRATLGDPPDWLLVTRVEKGARSKRRPAKWDPFLFAICLLDNKNVPLPILKKAFNATYLREWREVWEDRIPEHWKR